MAETLREKAAKLGISRTAYRYREKHGIPLDAPKLSPKEAAARASAIYSMRCNAEQRRKKCSHRGTWNERIVRGEPHPWHKLIAGLCVK